MNTKAKDEIRVSVIDWSKQTQILIFIAVLLNTKIKPTESLRLVFECTNRKRNFTCTIRLTKVTPSKGETPEESRILEFDLIDFHSGSGLINATDRKPNPKQLIEIRNSLQDFLKTKHFGV